MVIQGQLRSIVAKLYEIKKTLYRWKERVKKKDWERIQNKEKKVEKQEKREEREISKNIVGEKKEKI